MLVNVGRSLLGGTERKLPSSGSSAFLSVYKDLFSDPGASSPRRRPWGSACCLQLSYPKHGFRMLTPSASCMANQQSGSVPGCCEPQSVSFPLHSTCCDGAARGATLM